MNINYLIIVTTSITNDCKLTHKKSRLVNCQKYLINGKPKCGDKCDQTS